MSVQRAVESSRAMALACVLGGFAGCTDRGFDDPVDESRNPNRASDADAGGGDAEIVRGPGGIETRTAGGLAGPGDAGPQLEVTPASLALGPVVVGSAAFARVTLHNAGSGPMSPPLVSISESGGGNDFSIAQDQCQLPLEASESCDVRIQVLPTRAGPLEATLFAESDGGSLSVPLTAEGLEGGELVLVAAPGSFANLGGVLVGEAGQGTFQLSNPSAVSSGSFTISLVNPAFRLLEPGQDDCSPGETTLVSGESCGIRVSFEPTKRGPEEATLVVTSEGQGSTSLGLSGRGLIPGVLATTREAVDFQGVVLGATGEANIELRNDGDDELAVSSVTLDGAAADQFTILANGCGENQALEAGQSCSVTVGFQPSAVARDAAATLVVTSPEAGTLSIALSGDGLLPGSLEVAAADGASLDFGPVRLGETLAQTFEVTNPGSEPSGEVTLAASGDFAVLAPEGDECQPGVTTLVDGASCRFRVGLTPTAREPRSGSLTVSGALAGSTTVNLTGRGIVPARLALERDEINFERVVIGAPASASVSVRNDGDEAMRAPTVRLVSPGGGPVRGFAFDSECDAELDLGQSCQVSVTFDPERPGPHTARLQLDAGEAGQASTLLIGTAIAPGELRVTDASGTNFGDVALGQTRELDFTVTNPGGVAAGRLNISSSNERFRVDAGSCGNASGAGLVDGDSCSFTVSFAPNSPLAQTATVSVRSSGAGETSLSLSGRGRRPATLVGSNAFDFATVIVEDQSNARTWTVQNDGDLATGSLSVNASSGEFPVANDTCSGRSLGAGLSCSMSVRFRPTAAGARRATITVRDPSGSGPDAVLELSGFGEALPGVGGDCSVGGRCAGGASCENHSNGSSRVCCAEDCSGAEFCAQSQNFQGCELPTVSGGARCQAGVNVCQQGFTCNDPSRPGFCCRNGCDGDCDTCGSNGECVARGAGDPGGCPFGRVCSGNSRQCQCGPGTKECNGQCIPSSSCCGQCPTCTSCGNDGQCSARPSSDNRCGPVNCGASSNQCTTLEPPPSGQCSLGQCSQQCVERNRPQGFSCGPNSECDGSGNCEDTRADNGSSCSSGSECLSGNCERSAASPNSVQGVCCSQSCGAGTPYCRTTGVGQQQCVECAQASDCFSRQCNTDGSCARVPDGGECEQTENCRAGSTCDMHWADADDDEYASVGAAQQRFCRRDGFDKPNYTRREPTGSNLTTDCLELPGAGANVHPGQADFFEQPLTVLGGGGFDYDCSGEAEAALPIFSGCAAATPSDAIGNCRGFTTGYAPSTQTAACGSVVGVNFCSDTDRDGVCTVNGQGIVKQCH